MMAIAVLMVLLPSSIRCVPPSTREMFLGRETVLVAGYFSLALPLIMSAILSVSTSVSRVATIVLIFVVVSAATFFFTCFQDWQIIPIVIPMPTVCLGIGCGMLYLTGFRLLLPDPNCS